MVDLYSAFGVGINYSDYSEETDYYSAYRTLGAAFDVCALGVSVGKKHWFGAFELGGTTAFGYRIGDDKPRLELPIPFARLLRVSVGYRFWGYIGEIDIEKMLDKNGMINKKCYNR